MKLIGLTGGIATGKSTVSKMIHDLGHKVIDADVLAREVVQSGSFGLEALVHVFGTDILTKNHELNREVLREKLFSDKDCRRVVENITHPLIQWRAKQEFANLESKGETLVFYDAALIFEKNLMNNFDYILVAHTPSDIQIKRLMSRDKVDEKTAVQRISSQWPLDKKKEGAHYLIDNGTTLAETEKQTRDLIEKLKQL
jgi:dephospho-CoA kinase